MGKQMLAQPQEQFPASVWESAGLAKSARERLKRRPRQEWENGRAHFKDEETEAQRGRGLGAAGRMADNGNEKNEKKTRRLKKGGVDSTVRQSWRRGRTPASGTKDLQK